MSKRKTTGRKAAKQNFTIPFPIDVEWTIKVSRSPRLEKFLKTAAAREGVTAKRFLGEYLKQNRKVMLETAARTLDTW